MAVVVPGLTSRCSGRLTAATACERALHELAPEQHPATHELFGTPRYTRPLLDVIGVQTHLPACYGE